jgi:crotonobetainyl-CoA:carnitine CoA-transferase CaiB-like acyl-CoA transferase
VRGKSGGPGTPWADWARAAEDPRRAAEKPEALDGLLVLDCAVAHYGGHVLGGFLGELGAEVVKLEPPGGDPARAWGPLDVGLRGEGLAYLAEGRNRYYATLDLASAGGQTLFRQLAARADVVIEGFPPGQMDAWGIGYRQLEPVNPRLIYVALSTHGQFGPRAEGSGPEYDLIDQALSGLAYHHRRARQRRTRSGTDPRGELDRCVCSGGVGRCGHAGRPALAGDIEARPDDRRLGRRGPHALP